MPPTKHNSAGDSTVSTLTATQIFELLAHDRRRLALESLRRAVGTIHVSELADQIALCEGEHTYTQYERVCTGLVHQHLPKLAESGVVQYESTRETVALLETADQLRPYLDLAAADSR